MRFEEAWARVTIAGRELGGGPAEAAKRLTDFDQGVEYMTKRNVPENNARAILLGTAVGLVMAEDDIAMDTLKDIERQWRTGHDISDDPGEA